MNSKYILNKNVISFINKSVKNTSWWTNVRESIDVSKHTSN